VLLWCELTATFNLSDDPIWETPPHIFKFGCELFNFTPEIDVCATAQDKKCEIFIGKDSLNKEWHRPFFMNPPYGHQVKDWIKKAYLSHLKYNVSGLALLFAKTDTHAWHKYIFDKSTVHFLEGRLHFFKDGKESINPAPYPSALVFWRAK